MAKTIKHSFFFFLHFPIFQSKTAQLATETSATAGTRPPSSLWLWCPSPPGTPPGCWRCPWLWWSGGRWVYWGWCWARRRWRPWSGPRSPRRSLHLEKEAALSTCGSSQASGSASGPPVWEVLAFILTLVDTIVGRAGVPACCRLQRSCAFRLVDLLRGGGEAILNQELSFLIRNDIKTAHVDWINVRPTFKLWQVQPQVSPRVWDLVLKEV